MKEIRLSKGKVAMVDDADFEFLSKFRWISFECYPGKFYAKCNIKHGEEHKTIYMHRLILMPKGKKELVDHIDGNTLNNQKHNLRIADAAGNSANRKSQPGTSSNFLGVYWHSSAKKWVATIAKNKKRHYLGVFNREEDAAIAYNKAAKEFHGDFANLNIINKTAYYKGL